MSQGDSPLKRPLSEDSSDIIIEKQRRILEPQPRSISTSTDSSQPYQRFTHDLTTSPERHRLDAPALAAPLLKELSSDERGLLAMTPARRIVSAFEDYEADTSAGFDDDSNQEQTLAPKNRNSCKSFVAQCALGSALLTLAVAHSWAMALFDEIGPESTDVTNAIQDFVFSAMYILLLAFIVGCFACFSLARSNICDGATSLWP
jgi:hypothetical protein